MFANRQPKTSVPTTSTRAASAGPVAYARTPPTVVSMPTGVPVCNAPWTQSGQDMSLGVRGVCEVLGNAGWKRELGVWCEFRVWRDLRP